MDDPRGPGAPMPIAAPDHSDPASRAMLDPRAPLRVGDRVAWVRKTPAPLAKRQRKPRTRTIEQLGTVAVVEPGWVQLTVDAPPDIEVWAPAGEVHPRPGR